MSQERHQRLARHRRVERPELKGSKKLEEKKRVELLLGIMVLYQFIDWLSTSIIVAHSNPTFTTWEGNPIMAAFLNMSPEAFAVVKLTIGPLAVIAIFEIIRRLALDRANYHFTSNLLKICDGVFAAVLMSNAYVLLQQMNYR